MSWLFPATRGYRREWLRSDLSGFTVWAVLVPEALAYATIAVAEKRGEIGGNRC